MKSDIADTPKIRGRGIDGLNNILAVAQYFAARPHGIEIETDCALVRFLIKRNVIIWVKSAFLFESPAELCVWQGKQQADHADRNCRGLD